MSQLEDFDDTPVPARKIPPSSAKPLWSKALAWGVLALGGLYLLNPVAGVDLVPDFIPIAGNLDEAAVVFIVLGALRYLNIPLPDFIESWIQPSRQLPETIDPDEG